MDEKVAPATSALARVIEHAAEAYGQDRGKDFVDLTARAWVWKCDAWDHDFFERRGRGQSMWLKDAIKEAMRAPSAVKCIEYETEDGQTHFLWWSGISQIWEQKELWKD
jgi:hypothetical protein